MSHVTTIIDNGIEHKIVTQQYEVGLYVIEDNDPAKQYCVDAEEVEFHKTLREKFEFNPDKSTVL